MNGLLQDLQHAVRHMRKSPGFAIVAVLTLALGIGANTAIFSVVNGVLLNPLPYPAAERLVTLFHHKPNFVNGSISYLNFLDWQRDNRAFDAMAAYREDTFKLTGLGEAENLRAEMLSAGFFEILGVKPVLGRTFGADDDRLGADPTVMISEGLWKRKFGSDPHIVGRAIVLDGKPRTVIGIVPASFQLRQWNFRPSEVYTPIGEFSEPQFRNRSSAWGTDALARLKPGVTLAMARQDMERVNRGLQAEYPDVDAGIATTIVPLKDEIVGDVRPALWVLMGAVLIVLLIACVNVANLQLARSTTRQREFAVRVALGARQFRLVRQLLTESLVMACTGGAVGLLFAFWGAKAAVAAIPTMLPRADNVAIDGRVLLFTLLISVVAGVVFGLAPALRISRPDVNATLNQTGRSLAGAHPKAQAVFVTVEMALALVLLIGAGLMIRTLQRLWDVDPGFDPRGVIVFDITPSISLSRQPPAAILNSFREMESAARSVPGVESASLETGALPLRSDDEEPFWTDEMPRPEHEADLPLTLRYSVDPAYRKLMRLPLLRGRFFTDADNEQAARVIVVDESFANRYFPGQNPVGKYVHFSPQSTGGERTDQIVGVVGHLKQFGLAPDKFNLVEAEVYEPFQQIAPTNLAMVAQSAHMFVRSSGTVAPESVFPGMRHALTQLDSQMVVDDLQPMQKMVADSIARQRFAMTLFSIFAAIALLLASLGVYGVLSYIVGQRTREVGIRMALGAQKANVVGSVLRDGARMTLPGIGIGLLAALVMTRLMSTMLFGVTPTDFVTFTSVPLILTAVALLACYLPARRAASLDPVQALRAE